MGVSPRNYRQPVLHQPALSEKAIILFFIKVEAEVNDK
jgi:hypothetical protein